MPLDGTAGYIPVSVPRRSCHSWHVAGSKGSRGFPETTPGSRRVSTPHPRTEADVLNHLDRMQHSLKQVTAEMDECIEVAKERMEQAEQGQADGIQ